MHSCRNSYKLFLLLFPRFFIAGVVSLEGLYFFYQQPTHPRDCREVYAQCSSTNSSGVYVIKPDGYPHPFEVYCDYHLFSGGWTVIQRQKGGSLTFKRNWEDYRNGFGFLSRDFYIGNDKLSYLTNQNVYELRIDMMLANGSEFYVKYSSFRVSDELSQYKLINAEEFSGNSSCVATSCPIELTHESCTCETSCGDSVGMADCHKICVEACVPKRCYVAETNSFLLNGDTYVNSDCSKRCTCSNDHLDCDPDYHCSSNAVCRMQDGVQKCYCNSGYEGDGVTCTSPYTDCNDVQNGGNTRSGVYSIRPARWTGSHFDVYCNMTIDGGGWTVFQRRVNGSTNFYRNWTDYKIGFGNLHQEFWLGNEKLYYLTQQATYEYRVDFVYSASSYHNKYSTFRIDDESNKYKVTDLGSRTGTHGYSLYYTRNIEFSTYDQDNDGLSYDCAEKHRSGWWHGGDPTYHDCGSCCYWQYGSSRVRCSYASLNGYFNGGNGENIFDAFINCHIKYTEMKIRRAH